MKESHRSCYPGEEPYALDEARSQERSEFGSPVAIIGMACRFPRADGLSAFWRLLEAGGNAVQEGLPGSGIGRVGALFPDDTGQVEACRFGAYLDELERFDAAFFRISPVEAELLDPQQRLILETSWRALEDAGIDSELLKDSRTGVYAGISNNDYRGLILEARENAGSDEPAASLYAVTGTSLNTAIGRVAFALGLGGPAMAVDTACSSSLVATHQAVTGLQRGDADLALAGGVNIILSGRLLEFRANAGMLSPDGQCKTFDASANGYVRGEGCGILVLKRLADAEADGDRIWGVIRGTALNQDGASPGLTVPNGAAQERVIQAALKRAGVQPSDIDYLEAHGTGTEVGDPIEINATAAVYGRGRDAGRPLLIGSVKTNIGHLESAAGAAGMIKAVLAMNRGVIPKHLHFRNPNPEMDWERLPLQVASTATPWPIRPGRPPLAGVSGFGWSGTNAHVVLEGYTPPGDAPSGRNEDDWIAGAQRPIAVSLPVSLAPLGSKDRLAPRGTRLLPLSGKSGAALRDMAARYLEWLAEHRAAVEAEGAASGPLLSDMAWSAGIGRSHFGYRAGVVFRDAESLREGLRAIVETDQGPASPKVATVAFVYTGQASQWPGMGAALYASEPVVRAVLDRCDEVFGQERGGSLLDVMFGRPGAVGDLDDPQWKQPAIYALECALTALWSSLGIRPDVVLGHSLGEIAAAHTAGVFSLEDGLRLAAARGSLVGALPGEGAMAAVFAPASRVAAALDEHNAVSQGVGVCIAADNGAHQVISGPATDIAAILERLEAVNIRVARLRKSPAYHSAMIEPAMDGLEAALSQLAFAPPSLPFVSNLSGRTVGSGEVLDARYWRQQMRAPVAYRACVETLARLGVGAVVEIGPHAVLGPMTTLAWPETGQHAVPAVVSSLRRPATGEEPPSPGSGGGFVEAVAGTYEAGLPLRFDGLFASEERRRIALPGYPFQRERYWVEAPKRRRSAVGHPLLGVRHDSASGEVAFDTELFPSDPVWLGDHRVFNRLIAPGALYGAMAVSACTSDSPDSAVVEDFQMQSALVFPEGGADDGSGEEGRRLQVLLDGSAEGASRRVRILSRGATDQEWTLHAEGPGLDEPRFECVANRRVAESGTVEGRSGTGGACGLLPSQGRSRNRSRPLVPHAGGALVAAGRSVGRGIPAGLRRPERAGYSPARARRLLSGDGSGSHTGRIRRGGHLSALRVGAARLAGTAAGSTALPCPNEGGTGPRRRRIAGGDQRGHRSARSQRSPDRHPRRVHGEAGDAERAARRHGGDRGSALRSHMARPRLAAGHAAGGLPPDSVSRGFPLAAVLPVSGRGGDQGRGRERPAGRNGAGVVVLRACGPGTARVEAQGKRGRGSDRAARAPRGYTRARASLPPDS